MMQIKYSEAGVSAIE